MNENKGRFIELLRWPEYHAWPTVSGLRHIRERQVEHGCSNVFKKVAGRILIDESAFFDWVKTR